ncbi:TPA: WD40/YVTN/BNR-like repeat-containing protein [Pseudomonas aeruginosa]
MLGLSTSSASVLANTAEKTLRSPADRPALHAAKAASANIVAATHAGRGDASRIVAVGDYGVVLLSDDAKTFRQAAGVPVQSMLTDVNFLDAEHGWAVGHDGVVLATSDGGEHWRLLRRDEDGRVPLLGVWFQTLEHGIAVGQFGMAIETHNGGETWSIIHPAVDDTEMSDLHLNGITGAADGQIIIVGERGFVFVSADGGKSWDVQSTGENGSLWNVIPLRDGRFMAAGIGGHLYVADPNGRHWRRIMIDTQESLTGLAQLDDGTILVVGFGGLLLTSHDEGQTFVSTFRADRLPLTSVVGGTSRPVFFSPIGLVRAD